ncbi:caspase family protein [Leptolyngbya sp. AN02str]|uniref:nSTAND1 domain-containing NTPase n=1 Tax=Leptolyngbya sp. AN02str TaxID=3423363 RepID=UPI003D322742
MSRDALVVGINTYRYLSGLQAPARDAEAIAQVFHTQGDFRVQRLPEIIQSSQPRIGQSTPVTLRDLETALINLFKPKGKNIPHTAVFYFSGHGIQRDAGIQEGYLAVSDSNPEAGFYGLSLFWLRRLLQESPVRQRIVILDCCHSGELLNVLEADPGAKAGTDRLFIAASREYEVAYESLDGSYSVLTKALLEGLDSRQTASGIVTGHSLTAHVSQRLKGELQQPLFENSGSEIILTRAGVQSGLVTPTATGTTQPSVADVCPYRGLQFFDEAHADFFFGREELTDQLLNKIQSSNFVTVLGASGSGKSSLARAGVLHELRQGKHITGSDRWRLKLITPSENPMRSLASAFIDSTLPDLERAEQLRRAEQFLQAGGQGLAQLIRATLAPETSITTGIGDSPRARMVLLIDQFEEVFTLCRDEAIRRQFFNCLITAIESCSEQFTVVPVLRADFFNKCLRYDNLARYLKRKIVRVMPLSYEQIKNTIVRPAKKVGLQCEPNLVYTMLLDVMGSPGELPLLQYTLLELWQRRQLAEGDQPPKLTLNTYTELGGVRGTLQTRATQIYDSLPANEQAAAKRIFLALTQLDEGTEDTRRRVTKLELISPAFPLELVDQTLEKLVAAKLVVTNQPANEDSTILDIQETVDIAHEALIRNWPLLRGWLDENRALLLRQRRLEREAQEWVRLNRPKDAGHLLHGSRLMDARDFLRMYPHELSAIASQYIQISLMRHQRERQKAKLLKLGIPTVLTAAVAIALNQYQVTLQTQAEKAYQANIATSRERAAIAQSILQEPQRDSMAALLISRLAVEQGERTYEAQSSLRAALRDLRLQLQFEGHKASINQLVFSANGRYMATASLDGTICLWSETTQVIRVASRIGPKHQLQWQTAISPKQSEARVSITELAFSPNASQIAAIAADSNQIKIWDSESGILQFEIELPEVATHIAYSPDGKLLAASSGNILTFWDTQTGQSRGQMSQTWPIDYLAFGPTELTLLLGSANGSVELWDVLPLSTTPDTTKPMEQFVGLEAIATLAHNASVTRARFSPSGQWIVTTSSDGRARLWDVATGKLNTVLSTQFGFEPIADMEPAVESAIAQPAQPVSISHITDAKVNPEETLIITIDTNGRKQVWNLQTQTLQAELAQWPVSQQSHSAPLIYSPNGELLVSTHPKTAQARDLQAQDAQPAITKASIWDVNTGEQLSTVENGQSITQAAFSPDNAYLVTASEAGMVYWWSTGTGTELPSVKLSNSSIQWSSFIAKDFKPLPDPLSEARDGSTVVTDVPQQAIAPSPEALVNRLMTVNTEGQLQQWTIVTDEELPSSDPSTNPLNTAKQHLHSSQLAKKHPLHSARTAMWERVKELLSQEPSPESTAQQKSKPAAMLSLQPEETSSGEVAAATSQHSTLELDPVSNELLTQPIQPWEKQSVSGVTLSADGQWMAIATAQGKLILQQRQPDSQYSMTQELTTREVMHQLSFSPMSDVVAGVTDNRTVRLWNVASGEVITTLKGHRDEIHQVKFSPDGTKLITVSRDRTAILWDRGSGRMLLRIPHSAEVNSADFSPDGMRLVTTQTDGSIRISDVATGTPNVFLTGHKGNAIDAQFSFDGQTVVTAGVDGTVRLWNAKDGTEQAQLRPEMDPSSQIQRVFFSPDGHYVAAQTDQGRIYLWAASWPMLMKLARDRSHRQLTSEECTRYLRVKSHACPNLQLPVHQS